MLAKMFKCCSVVALLAMIVFHRSAGYLLLTQFLVCAAAIMGAAESFQIRKPALAIGFILVALAFNPVLPLPMSKLVLWGTATVTLGIFVLSLVTFRSRPRLSMASITDRTPGSESL